MERIQKTRRLTPWSHTGNNDTRGTHMSTNKERFNGFSNKATDKYYRRRYPISEWLRNVPRRDISYLEWVRAMALADEKAHHLTV